MDSTETQGKSPAAFPSWLGPAWLFIIFIEVGWDWDSLFLFGGLPWFGAWLVWWQLARTRFFLELSSATIDELWRWSGAVIWMLVIALIGAIYYANHFLPHGPMVDTGNVVCSNDDRDCGEQFKEDTRAQNIPEWAKFLKDSESLLLLGIVVMAGIFASSRPRGGYGQKGDN